MRINNVTAEGFVNTNTTIVWSLRARIATKRPTKWPFNIFLQQGVFLLEAIPGFISYFKLIIIEKSHGSYSKKEKNEQNKGGLG